MLKRFSFLFISSEFIGKFEEKLDNISKTTNINDGAMNVVKLLLFAENIKTQYMDLEDIYNLITQNFEIKLIDE